MNKNQTQTVFYCLAIFLLAGYICYIGASIIIPVMFAALLSVFISPIQSKIVSFINIKWLSIILAFLAIILPLLLITTLSSYQLINIMDSLPSIGEGIKQGLEKIVNVANNIVPGLGLDVESLKPDKDANIETPLKLLGQGLVSTSHFIGSTALVLVYSFLFLYYKDSFKNFLTYIFGKDNKTEVKETLKEMIDTIQSYIGGLGLVVVILSVLNSIGLTLIGIEHAIFWGVLAGMLAIIPYIGTLLGGLLPFIYTLATADASWQPYAVVGYYLFIQQVEGNFITPKIVGDKVDVNPLFSIFSLVVFGSFWGISGIILALPLISIAKIILSQFDNTKAISVLMSSDVSSKKGVFKRLAD